MRFHFEPDICRKLMRGVPIISKQRGFFWCMIMYEESMEGGGPYNKNVILF